MILYLVTWWFAYVGCNSKQVSICIGWVLVLRAPNGSTAAACFYLHLSLKWVKIQRNASNTVHTPENQLRIKNTIFIHIFYICSYSIVESWISATKINHKHRNFNFNTNKQTNHCLLPFRTKHLLSGLYFARVAIPPGSLPKLGSVNPKQPISSPRAENQTWNTGRFVDKTKCPCAMNITVEECFIKRKSHQIKILFVFLSFLQQRCKQTYTYMRVTLILTLARFWRVTCNTFEMNTLYCLTMNRLNCEQYTVTWKYK